VHERSALHRRRGFILAVLVLAWLGAFVATHVPAPDIPRRILELGQVVLHAVGFFALSSLFLLTLAAFGVRPYRRAAVVLVAMALYAAADEYTQQFVHRSSELADWLVDTVATAVAVAAWEGIFRLTRRTA